MRTLNSGFKKMFQCKVDLFQTKKKNIWCKMSGTRHSLYSDLAGDICQNIFHVFLFFCTYTNWKAKAVFNNPFAGTHSLQTSWPWPWLVLNLVTVAVIVIANRLLTLCAKHNTNISIFCHHFWLNWFLDKNIFRSRSWLSISGKCFVEHTLALVMKLSMLYCLGFLHQVNCFLVLLNGC